MPYLRDIVVRLAQMSVHRQAIALLPQQQSLLQFVQSSPSYGREMARIFQSIAIARSLATRNLEWIKIPYSESGGIRERGKPAPSSSISNSRGGLHPSSARGTAVKSALPRENALVNNELATSSHTVAIDRGEHGKKGNKGRKVKKEATNQNLVVHGSTSREENYLSTANSPVAMPVPNITLSLYDSLISGSTIDRSDMFGNTGYDDGYRYYKYIASAIPNAFYKTAVVSSDVVMLRSVFSKVPNYVTKSVTSAKKTNTPETQSGEGYFKKNESEFHFSLGSAMAFLQANTIAGRIAEMSLGMNKTLLRDGILQPLKKRTPLTSSLGTSSKPVFRDAPLQEQKAKGGDILEETLEKISAVPTKAWGGPETRGPRADKTKAYEQSPKKSTLEDALDLSRTLQLIVAGVFASRFHSLNSKANLHPRIRMAHSGTPTGNSSSSSFSSSSHPDYLTNFNSQGVLPLHRYMSIDGAVQQEIKGVNPEKLSSRIRPLASLDRNTMLRNRRTMERDRTDEDRTEVKYSNKPSIYTTVSKMITTITNAARAKSLVDITSGQLISPATYLQKALFDEAQVKAGSGLRSLGTGDRLSSLTDMLDWRKLASPYIVNRIEAAANQETKPDQREKVTQTAFSLPSLVRSSNVRSWKSRHLLVNPILYSTVSMPLERAKQAMMKGAKLTYNKDHGPAGSYSLQTDMGSLSPKQNLSSKKKMAFLERQMVERGRYARALNRRSNERTINVGEKIGNPQHQKAEELRQSNFQHHNSYEDSEDGKEAPVRNIMATLQQKYAKYTFDYLLQYGPRSRRETALLATRAGRVLSASHPLLSAPTKTRLLGNRKNSAINPRKMQDSFVDLPSISQQMASILVATSSLKAIRDSAATSVAAVSSQQMVSSPVPNQVVVNKAFKSSHSSQYADEMAARAGYLSSHREQFGMSVHSSKNANDSKSNYGRVGRSDRFTENTKHEGVGKELSLRTLRKMMEQVFQDELRRYGL